MKGVALHKTPAALLAVFLGIEGETGVLDGSKISPDGAVMAALWSSELGHSDPMVSGLNGPQKCGTVWPAAPPAHRPPSAGVGHELYLELF